ncbi:MAG: hypothetical protein FWE02_02490 [Defluviitaleaceae bacterium]|nr:hypothetical protein [Defluviitaleaceae bacterium]
MKRFLTGLLILVLSFGAFNSQALWGYQVISDDQIIPSHDIAIFSETYVSEAGINHWSGYTGAGNPFYAHDGVLVKTGITYDGIPFRAYKAAESFGFLDENGEMQIMEIETHIQIVQRSAYSSTFITREVVFQGTTRPPSTQPWREFMSNRWWTGTLNLQSMRPSGTGNGMTVIGVYSGVVTTPN